MSPKLIVLLASSAFSFGGGWIACDKIVYQRHLQKDAQHMMVAVRDARKAEGTGQQVTTEVAAKREQAQGASREVTSALIKEVSHYVPTQATGPLTGSTAVPGGQVGGGSPSPQAGGYQFVSVGFGRLLDYAALGINPPVSLTPSERGHLPDPLPIDLPSVAGSIIGNYGVLHQCSAEVGAWREWYNANDALWRKSFPGSYGGGTK